MNPQSMKAKLIALTLVCAATAAVASAGPVTATLYYTTFSPTDVYSVPFTYNGSTAALGGSTLVRATNGADGLIFNPNDGNLLIAGQSQNTVTQVTTGGTITGTISPGANGQAYHLALAPDGTVWTMANGGTATMDIFSLTPFANGTTHAVTGADTDIRGVAFIGNQGYYGTAPDGGYGNFGTISFNGSSFVTTRLATNLPAHGLTYDPFTGDIFVSSANCIDQMSASGTVLSSYCAVMPGSSFQFDQTAVDGTGQLWAASNFGQLLFLDYQSSGLIGSSSYVWSQFLATNLDDIAPLSGAGGPPVPEPASLLLLGTGLVGVARSVRRRRSGLHR